jgi:hypothetical protein
MEEPSANSLESRQIPIAGSVVVQQFRRREAGVLAKAYWTLCRRAINIENSSALTGSRPNFPSNKPEKRGFSRSIRTGHSPVLAFAQGPIDLR